MKLAVTSLSEAAENDSTLNSSASSGPKAREWELVRVASCTDACGDSGGERERLRLSIAGRVDWRRALELAERHGTTELLYRKMQPLGVTEGNIPAEVLASLQKNSERNLHKSLFLAREVMRIGDCLKALGIEALSYKGVALSETYYGDGAMRPGGDMDFLVRDADVARIRDAVRDLGYTPRLKIPEAAAEDYIASGYEFTFDGPAGKNLLEMQWALLPRFYAVDFDMEALFARAVEASVAGYGVKTPSAEDLLLLLSVHAAKHVWGRLIWLCDIARILRRRNLNWEWVGAQARALGIARILHVTLLLAKRLVEAEIPEAIFNELLSDRAAVAFADQMTGEIAAGRIHESENISYFRLMMRLRERRRDRLRFLTRLTFTPGPGEWAVVRLPRALFPLYRVIRMGRLVGRLARAGR